LPSSQKRPAVTRRPSVSGRTTPGRPWPSCHAP
jgi:hypothetical protein